jgi:pSer/pThr/pTyr-binding forkhead associated (FHA) protein
MGVRLIVVPTARSPHESASPAPSPDVSWEFAQPRVVLGRSGAADVLLPHPSVSTRHATIEAEGVRYAITDHGSLNGTWVNGQRIVPERKKPLRDGDRIDLGLFTLRFVANVPVNDVPSRDQTAAIARRLLRAVRASEPSTPRRLVVANGAHAGRTYELPPPPARLVVGRAESADVSLDDGDASREHAELVIDAEGVLVRDLGSKNGVLVGERRVSEARLVDRDELRIGATVLAYEDVAEPSLRAIEALAEVSSPAPSLPPPPPSEPPPAPAVEPPPASEAPPAALLSMAPSEAGTTAAADPADPRELAPEARPRRGIGAGEWAVYGLALLVFLLSAAGLVWLLRAG